MNVIAAECAIKKHHPEWSNVSTIVYIALYLILVSELDSRFISGDPAVVVLHQLPCPSLIPLWPEFAVALIISSKAQLDQDQVGHSAVTFI